MKSAERSAECPVDKSAKYWLGRQDSNLRMAVPKTAALPLGYAPAGRRHAGADRHIAGRARKESLVITV